MALVNQQWTPYDQAVTFRSRMGIAGKSPPAIANVKPALEGVARGPRWKS